VHDQSALRIAELRRSPEAYVTSFCEREDRANQWLHYGRSGRGVALDFDPERLVQRDHGARELVPVLYDEHDQRQLVAGMYAVAADSMNAHGLDPKDPTGRSVLFAQVCSIMMRAAAERIKHPSLFVEQEWQILLYRTEIPDLPAEKYPLSAQERTEAPEAPGYNLEFRTSEGRIIPYVPVEFSLDSLREFVLGWSCELARATEGLVTLLVEETASAIRA
jgi:hypothetical protein